MHHFAFVLQTLVHDSSGKASEEIFLGRIILTSFHRLVLVPEMNSKFSSSNVHKLFKEVQRKFGQAQKVEAKYYNMRRRGTDIKMDDNVLLEMHFLCSKAHKKVTKLGPKFDGPYLVLKVVKNNLNLDIEGNQTTVNMDQNMVYKTSSSLSSSFSSNSVSNTSTVLQQYKHQSSKNLLFLR